MKKVLAWLLVSLAMVSSSFAAWEIDNYKVYNADWTITTCSDDPAQVWSGALASSDLMDSTCGANNTTFQATTEITGELDTTVTSVFSSIGSLITSPLGGLIIFGLAISYLFYVKRMAKARNARG